MLILPNRQSVKDLQSNYYCIDDIALPKEGDNRYNDVNEDIYIFVPIVEYWMFIISSRAVVLHFYMCWM